jgi:hypothetical protein
LREAAMRGLERHPERGREIPRAWAGFLDGWFGRGGATWAGAGRLNPARPRPGQQRRTRRPALRGHPTSPQPWTTDRRTQVQHGGHGTQAVSGQRLPPHHTPLLGQHPTSVSQREPAPWSPVPRGLDPRLPKEPSLRQPCQRRVDRLPPQPGPPLDLSSERLKPRRMRDRRENRRRNNRVINSRHRQL